MKKIISYVILTLITAFSAQSVMAGNCDHSWQTASDGSACGGRAADVRPGGGR